MLADTQYNLGLDENELRLIYDALKGGNFSNDYLLSMSRLAVEIEFRFPHLQA